jgi:hypothetical protein
MKGSIFIYGMLQRSGTNLLNQMLLLHPDCAQPVSKIRENWFLHCSDSLYEYSEQLYRIWSNNTWHGDDFSRSEFYSSIGDAMLTYLGNGISDASSKVLLSKTPSVQHLERCFQLFPSSKVVIVTRDPRDVAASAFNTWGRPVKQTIRDWSVACKAIYDFERDTPLDRYSILRFEDLVCAREEWTRKCLQLLNLEETRFPWQSLSELPVFGSSEEKTWQVKSVSESFGPVGRWRSLPAAQVKGLGRASPCSSYFGYPELPEDDRQPMPIREVRLQQGIVLKDKLPSTRLRFESLRERSRALRTGLRSLAEVVFGKRAVNFARKTRRGAARQGKSDIWVI